MRTLIGREIRDHVVYFVGAAVFSVFAIGLLFVSAFRDLQELAYVMMMPVACAVLLGSASLGASQMYSDRTNKITSFLSTLAVSRAQILTARFIVGVMAILVMLLPGVIVAIGLLHYLYPPLLFYHRIIIEIVASVFLVAVNCYGIGLLTGWTTSKWVPAVGCLLFPPVVLCLVVVKGVGIEGILVLGGLLLASLTCAWVKYASTPL